MVASQRVRSCRPRGDRHFALHLPVWYRIGDDARWHVSVTERISAREITVRAHQPNAGRRSVDLVVSLPSPATQRAACLVARGRIKRAQSRSRQNGRATFAISVSHSRLEPLQRVLDERAA